MIHCFRVLAFLTLAGVALGQAPKPAAPAKPATSIKTAAKAFEEAQQFYSDGNWVGALDAFQKFATNYPYSSAVPTARYYQGWCWANQGQYQQAANVLQSLITSTYSNHEIVAEATLKQAECYRELNEITKAIELYRRFQKLYPSHEMLPQALLGEAWALYRGKNSAGAKALIRLVQSRFFDNPEVTLNALFLLGQVLTEDRDFVGAAKVYKEISRQRFNPRAAQAMYLAAEAAFTRGEPLGNEKRTEIGRAHV